MVPFLRHIAEAHGTPVQGAAVPGDLALVPVRYPENHPDGGGLSRAVGADQTENARFGHREAQVVHRFFVAEGFADVPDR